MFTLSKFAFHGFSLLFLSFLCGLPVEVSAQNEIGETGIASYYHDMFVGRKTANGETFTQDKLTAAHKDLPLGTWVKVTNLENDSSVILRINDRMPPWNHRSIDLTVAAAEKLDYVHEGLTEVTIEIVPDPMLVKAKKKRAKLITTEIALQTIKHVANPVSLISIYSSNIKTPNREQIKYTWLDRLLGKVK